MATAVSRKAHPIAEESEVAGYIERVQGHRSALFADYLLTAAKQGGAKGTFSRIREDLRAGHAFSALVEFEEDIDAISNEFNGVICFLSANDVYLTKKLEDKLGFRESELYGDGLVGRARIAECNFYYRSSSKESIAHIGEIYGAKFNIYLVSAIIYAIAKGLIINREGLIRFLSRLFVASKAEVESCSLFNARITYVRLLREEIINYQDNDGNADSNIQVIREFVKYYESRSKTALLYKHLSSWIGCHDPDNIQFPSNRLLGLFIGSNSYWHEHGEKVPQYFGPNAYKPRNIEELRSTALSTLHKVIGNIANRYRVANNGQHAHEILGERFQFNAFVQAVFVDRFRILPSESKRLFELLFLELCEYLGKYRVAGQWGELVVKDNMTLILVLSDLEQLRRTRKSVEVRDFE